MTTPKGRKFTWRDRLLTASMLGALALLATSTTLADPHAGGESWSEWRGMGEGYVARRREAPAPDPERAARKIETGKVAARKGLFTETEVEALWLKTADEGLYRLPVTELAAWTGRVEKDLRNLLKKGKKIALTNRGLPVRWHYDEASDSVYFVAEAIDTMFTDINAYRLSKDNKVAETMGHDSGSGPGAGVPQGAFFDTLKFEQEPPYFYVPWALGDDVDGDYWFWDWMLAGYKDSISVTLDLPGAVGYGQGEIRVRLHGRTDVLEGNDHRVRAELNGVWIGEIEWDGLQAAELVGSFNQALLTSSNVLKLVSEYAPGDNTGQFLDEVTVSYWRQLVAVDDALWLRGLAPDVHTVGGFTSDRIFVVESPTESPRWRDDISIAPAGDGTFNVAFAAANEADYLVVADDAVNTPAVEEDLPSRLADRKNKADYLVIAPRELQQTAEALIGYRRNSFPRAMIAWLDDVYDEFSDGITDPKAIVAFITFVKEKWRQAPAYMVLLGKGTLDHKDRMGYGDSLLPAVMTATPWGPTFSDNRYMDVDGDGVMDFVYGRIPVVDDSEGLAYVDKLMSYETGAATSTRAVLVADNPDAAGDFHANSDELAVALEGFGYEVTKLYHPIDAVRANLTASATWEAAFVNYDGHGSYRQLGGPGENFINVLDVPALTNEALPVFAAMTCAAGYDGYPGVRSLAGDLVVSANGGAIVSLAPTGLSVDSDAHLISKAFADELLASRLPVGDALQQAQQQVAGQVSDFMTRIYQVVGDPAVYSQ